MADYSVHQSEFSDTTDDDWSAPEEKDFDTNWILFDERHCHKLSV